MTHHATSQAELLPVTTRRRTVLAGLGLTSLLLVGCSGAGEDHADKDAEHPAGKGGDQPRGDDPAGGTGSDGGIGSDGGNQADAEEFLDAHGLQGKDTTAIIDHLEALPLQDRPQDLMASVRPSQLLLSDAEGRELTLPIEGDFYLSTAPFVQGTHECWFHSLTTCTGELQEQDVEVTVTDQATGEVVHEGTKRTNPNGFFGLWLPRGGSFEMTCTVEGATSTTEVSTADDEDATCLTTMRLT